MVNLWLMVNTYPIAMVFVNLLLGEFYPVLMVFILISIHIYIHNLYEGNQP